MNDIVVDSHPLEALRHLLVISSDNRDGAAVFRRFVPFLGRNDLELHRVPPGIDVLELVNVTSFDLLVVGHPLQAPTMPELIATLRSEGSACRYSPVLVVAEAEALPVAQQALDHGVNRTIAIDCSDRELERALGDLLNVAPRVALRASLCLTMYIEGGGESREAETSNLSVSGMLVRGGIDFPLGTRFEFEFALPEDVTPIAGVAEVVRAADPEREALTGFAARFLAFQQVGRQRLEAFILKHGTR